MKKRLLATVVFCVAGVALSAYGQYVSSFIVAGVGSWVSWHCQARRIENGFEFHVGNDSWESKK